MQIREWPVLFKKTSTGAIQYWKVRVLAEAFITEVVPGVKKPDGPDVGVIVTEYGQFGTESPQMTSDTVSEGKNVGKKNETTAVEQAVKEANSRWEKQLKKGYVQSKESAEAEELDEIIEGGISPMLAHTFSKHGHKIAYPAYMQPKLDGIRCIAVISGGVCTLWSRTRKPINSMPHIQAELEACFGNMELVLDGELYNHKLKNNFEEIVSMVRQDKPHEDCTKVEYHVYDSIGEGTFEQRYMKLRELFSYYEYGLIATTLVPTVHVNEESEVMGFFERFRRFGYEGIMLRNAHGKYVNRRSYDLQKVKEFDDEEFDICGIEEGRGRLSGHVGAFICRTRDGKEFLAKMSGDTERLRTYFTNHSLWRGKRLTVQYQGLTGKEGVPRFPVGIAIRDYE